MSIGVVGAGDWGNKLIHGLQELGALSAVAETLPAVREDIASQVPSVDIYEDYELMLDSDILAVVVATPAHTHYEVAKKALQAGKDVLVEKPMSLSTIQAQELVKLAKENGRILMVGHMLLFQPAIHWIKSYLDSGQLGTVFSLHQKRLNLGRVRSIENALWSLGVHDIAVLLYLIGEAPCRVHAAGQSALQEGIEDDVHLHLEFPSGTHAHIHSSWLWPELTRRLTVIGSEAMLIYDEVDQVVMLHRKSINSSLDRSDNGEQVIFRGSGEPLHIELESFIEAITTRALPVSDGGSAVEVVRVLEEATRQLRSIKN